jgi:TusA-related sulfurtransferase
VPGPKILRSLEIQCTARAAKTNVERIAEHKSDHRVLDYAFNNGEHNGSAAEA